MIEIICNNLTAILSNFFKNVDLKSYIPKLAALKGQQQLIFNHIENPYAGDLHTVKEEHEDEQKSVRNKPNN